MHFVVLFGWSGCDIFFHMAALFQTRELCVFGSGVLYSTEIEGMPLQNQQNCSLVPIVIKLLPKHAQSHQSLHMPSHSPSHTIPPFPSRFGGTSQASLERFIPALLKYGLTGVYFAISSAQGIKTKVNLLVRTISGQAHPPRSDRALVGVAQ